MSALSPNAPLSVRNLLLAIGELDQPGAPNALPAFARPLDADQPRGESIGRMLEHVGGETTPANLRGKLLRTLEYVLSREGLPHEFAALAVAGLRDPDSEAGGKLRNRIQNGFEALATRLERAEPSRAAHAASSRRIGAAPESGLAWHGWSRIGTSSYWQKGGVLCMEKPGVCPAVLQPFDLRDGKLTGLKVTDGHAYFAFASPAGRDHGFREMHHASGSSSLNYVHASEVVTELRAHFSGLSAAESLRASGFVQVAPDTFELVVTDEHARHDFVALLDGERLAGVYQASSDKIHPALRGGDFRVVDVHRDRHDRGYACTVENVSTGLRFVKSGKFISQISFSRPLDSYEPTALGIHAPALPYRERTGFVVAGQNTSDAIRACESFNGISVEQLEDTMRPGRADSVRSMDGFLQPHESLRAEMAFQNDFVLAKGSTHQHVAAHLRQLHAAYRLGAHEVTYHGVALRFRGHAAMGGVQDSPFADGTGGGGGFYLSRVDAPDIETLVSPTAIDMIERWGFYEGRGCAWHVSPQKLCGMLGAAFAHGSNA